MVWGGISLKGKTDLVIVVGPDNGHTRTLTGVRYIEEILDHVVHYAGVIGDNFLLMHNSVRPHTTHAVTNNLGHVGIPVMELPPRSPDIHLIEDLWDKLKRMIRARIIDPSSLRDLVATLLEEWEILLCSE